MRLATLALLCGCAHATAAPTPIEMAVTFDDLPRAGPAAPVLLLHAGALDAVLLDDLLTGQLAAGAR